MYFFGGYNFHKTLLNGYGDFPKYLQIRNYL